MRQPVEATISWRLHATDFQRLLGSDSTNLVYARMPWLSEERSLLLAVPSVLVPETWNALNESSAFGS